MKTTIKVLTIFFFGNCTSICGFASEAWQEDWSREPVKSAYAIPFNELSKKDLPEVWKKLGFAKVLDNLEMNCFLDSESKMAIIVQQAMIIKSPIERVQSILDNINQYAILFPGYADVHILEKRNNQLLTSWEQKVPFPLSNIKYRMMYTLGKTNKTSFYRYQLSWSKTIKYNDGIILITPNPENSLQTLYFELDAWDADYGIGAALASNSIRDESVEGVYISDKAVQLLAEDSSLSPSDALVKAKKSLDKIEVKNCIKNQKAFKPL